MHYLQFFGDRKMIIVEHLPFGDEPTTRKHIELRLDSQDYYPDEEFVHPCWCGPELIYADDLKGNEVWLHKREQ